MVRGLCEPGGSMNWLRYLTLLFIVVITGCANVADAVHETPFSAAKPEMVHVCLHLGDRNALPVLGLRPGWSIVTTLWRGEHVGPYFKDVLALFGKVGYKINADERLNEEPTCVKMMYYPGTGLIYDIQLPEG